MLIVIKAKEIETGELKDFQFHVSNAPKVGEKFFIVDLPENNKSVFNQENTITKHFEVLSIV